MPHSRILNVALVGYGYVGKTFHAPLIAATPGLKLATVVSSDPAKVAADHPDARVVAELGAALADPAIELVVIATPPPARAPGDRRARGRQACRRRQALRPLASRGPRHG